MTASRLPSLEGDRSNPGQDLPAVEDVRAAFAEAGINVTVEVRTLALTASADGGMLIGIFIGVPIPEFTRLIADDAYLAIKNLLRRFIRHGSVDYAVYVGKDGVDALIEPDLPPEAFLKLQGTLPNAPSGRIIYNRGSHRWQDFETLD